MFVGASRSAAGEDRRSALIFSSLTRGHSSKRMHPHATADFARDKKQERALSRLFTGETPHPFTLARGPCPDRAVSLVRLRQPRALERIRLAQQKTKNGDQE
jgi:hypothetical protein